MGKDKKVMRSWGFMIIARWFTGETFRLNFGGGSAPPVAAPQAAAPAAAPMLAPQTTDVEARVVNPEARRKSRASSRTTRIFGSKGPVFTPQSVVKTLGTGSANLGGGR